MAADLATFRLYFPEWGAVADARVQLYLDDAEAYLNKQIWGDCYDKAVLYWSAHKLALSEQRVAQGSGAGGSGAGPLTSASVDGVSVGYAAPAWATGTNAGDAEYSKTPYGQEYLSLRQACLPSGLLMRCGC